MYRPLTITVTATQGLIGEVIHVAEGVAEGVENVLQGLTRPFRRNKDDYEQQDLEEHEESILSTAFSASQSSIPTITAHTQALSSTATAIITSTR